MSSLTVIQSESSLLHRFGDEGITVAPQALDKRDSSKIDVPYLRVVDDSYIEWLKTHKSTEKLSTSGRSIRPQRRVRTAATTYTQSAVVTQSRLSSPKRQALPALSNTGKPQLHNVTKAHKSFSLVGRFAAWVVAFVLAVSVGATLGAIFSPVYSEPTEPYIVQPGDTMWGLAQQSSNGSAEETIATIVSINNLDSTQLTPGQNLELPVHPARMK